MDVVDQLLLLRQPVSRIPIVGNMLLWHLVLV